MATYNSLKSALKLPRYETKSKALKAKRMSEVEAWMGKVIASTKIDTTTAKGQKQFIQKKVAEQENNKTLQDFYFRGMALVLADLSETAGFDPMNANEHPEELFEAGLPKDLAHHVKSEASQIVRDRIDGMLWRNNSHVRQIVQHVQTSRPRTVEQAVEIAETTVKPESNGTPKRTNGIEVSSVKTGETKLTEKGKEIVRDLSSRPTKRNAIFGFPAKRVVMWMGKNGYTEEQVGTFLQKQGASLSVSSIRIFIKWGNEQSNIKLTAENVKTIKEQTK